MIDSGWLDIGSERVLSAGPPAADEVFDDHERTGMNLLCADGPGAVDARFDLVLQEPQGALGVTVMQSHEMRVDYLDVFGRAHLELDRFSRSY